MRPLLGRALAGAVGAGAVSAGARRAGALGGGGARAAWIVGSLVVAGGGWRAGGALVAFFASSSLLSRRQRPASSAPAQARGSRRDAVQVLANGGVPMAAAVAMSGPARAAWAAAYYGSVAAAAADTWATEVGRGSRRPPRILLVGPRASPGTSGGMTARGCGGAVAGAAVIACFAAGDPPKSPTPDAVSRFAAVVVAGCLGSFVDSLLGATVQEVRRCPVCGSTTERPRHCDAPTAHLRGVSWIDNDGVNVAATVTGALVGWWLTRRWSGQRHGFLAALDREKPLVRPHALGAATRLFRRERTVRVRTQSPIRC